MVKDTSIVAYSDHVIDGHARTQRERILSVIRGDHSQLKPPVSRNELEYFFRRPAVDDGKPIKMSSICGRVKSLLQSGQIKVAKVDRDPITKKRVEYLEVVPDAPVQKEFDGWMPQASDRTDPS